MKDISLSETPIYWRQKRGEGETPIDWRQKRDASGYFRAFGRIDTNGDGGITADELAAYPPINGQPTPRQERLTQGMDIR